MSKNNKLVTTGVLAFSVMTGFLAPSMASASSVNGMLTMNIDQAALSSAMFGEQVVTYFDNAYNNVAINSTTPGINTTTAQGMQFQVNSASTPLSTDPSRLIQLTNFDYSGDPTTGTGQIGFSASLNLGGAAGYLKMQDLSMNYQNGKWVMKTNETAPFGTKSVFELINVTTDTIGDSLSLHGDLTFGSSEWAGAFGLTGSTVLGNVTITPSAVPLPAAAWLMGSALLGLTGYKRRQRKALAG